MVIYKTTNGINGKIYIGQDSKNNPEYLGSGTGFKEALLEFGKDNFTKEIIDHRSDRKELNLREEYWIAHYNATNPDIGYNRRPSAVGGHTVSDDLKQLISKRTKEAMEKSGASDKIKLGLAKKGDYRKKHTPETIEKMSGENNSQYGKSHKGWGKGLKRTEELKEKNRKKSLEWLEENTHSCIGKVCSEETRRKMSETMKAKYKAKKELEKKN